MTKHDRWIFDIYEANGAMGGITLTQWEEEFVESMDERIADEKSLTPKQIETLEKIWDRI